jgi:SWIM zinc finger
MSRRYGWYEPSKPIAVDGGVKARSKRGSIGSQWWSQRFIAVLESYGMSGRLQRGRAYARKGQVMEFSLGVGKVTARVQGSRPAPYKVSIGVLPLTVAQWKTVEARLAGAALFRAKLLAGEMPAEIEEVFAECGTPLFPRSASDLDMRCSCPDWEVPCKHLAAVCYVLAEAFDDDPFGLLAWRGRGKEELLSALRRAGRGPSGAAGGSSSSPGPGGTGTGGPGAGPAGGGEGLAGDDGAVSATRAVLADVAGAPLAGAARTPADFWSAGLSAARLRSLAAGEAVAETAPDLLLRMFEPPAVQVRGTDLRGILTSAYEQFAQGRDKDF